MAKTSRKRKRNVTIESSGLAGKTKEFRGIFIGDRYRISREKFK